MYQSAVSPSPYVCTSSAARSFGVAAPAIQNFLPLALRMCTSPDTFCHHLKTHYFQQAFRQFYENTLLTMVQLQTITNIAEKSVLMLWRGRMPWLIFNLVGSVLSVWTTTEVVSILRIHSASCLRLLTCWSVRRKSRWSPYKRPCWHIYPASSEMLWPSMIH